ncbi:SCO family protein [Vibrio sp. VB16]|uniref:SCO family protein n=1 Tax=Vibrio sp. VB16 TaxID=2785746 RepID=UPI00189E3887|nr:SCO family protein [Vibrio sp. VB16]UGA57762.1 SCO family protein [Vibrio sp. VB16]
MSRNWSLAIVIAFVLGYSVKVYMDMQNDVALEKQNEAAMQIIKDPVFNGKDDTETHIFDVTDNRIRVVYFGYTRCPDVCPTSLAMLSGALSSINEGQLAQLRPMFISIDPERDEANAAHQYAQYFHANIEGFSAPMATTKPVADHYGVIFRKTELEDSAIGYVVDHSSYFYFLKPDGTLITKVAHTMNSSPIVAAIEDVLKTE